MSDAVRDTIQVAAPPATVMEVITDIESYPEWQEEMRETEVLERDADGRPSRARLRVESKLVRTTYTLRYHYDSGVMAWELEEGDQLDDLRGSYAVTGDGQGGSEVTYELAVVPTMPLPGMLRRRAARRIVDTALRAMRERAEARA